MTTSTAPRPLTEVLAEHVAEVNEARLTRGAQAITRRTPFGGGEEVTIVRAEYLNHPAFVDVDGPKPARRERWLHVRFADGGRLLMHPSNLQAVR